MGILLLLLGVAMAAAGGEMFVRSTVGGAALARIPAGIVAATVAAFATSSPELSVAVNSATAGEPEISLGDALGSNVTNIGLVLAIAILLGGLTSRRRDLARDLPGALVVPVLLVLLSLDGELGRWDALALLTTFTAWMAVTILQARQDRSALVEVLADRTRSEVIRDGLIGLALLIAAGRLIVMAAQDIGELLGWDTFTVGAIMVAIATSTPELATVVIARLRHHDEVSVGTVLGSNIFNGLLVIGTAAAIHPITVAWNEMLLSAAAGIATLLLVIPGRVQRLRPWRGAVLLAIYALYLWALLATHEAEAATAALVVG